MVILDHAGERETNKQHNLSTGGDDDGCVDEIELEKRRFDSAREKGWGPKSVHSGVTTYHICSRKVESMKYEMVFQKVVFWNKISEQTNWKTFSMVGWLVYTFHVYLHR